MLTDKPELALILDRELIGFLTAVDGDGQPQTSPVWFIRDGEDIIVYNKADTPRLESVAANPRVAFNLRGDLRATGAVILEGRATVEQVSAASEFSGYVDKYGSEIERLGWTPESFSDNYSVGLRIEITRVRGWGLGSLAQ